MSRDSNFNVFMVAFCLCLVCSVLVSVAAVGLRERQELNKAEEKKKNILLAAGLYDESRSIADQFRIIQTRIADLQTGSFNPDINPSDFDSRAAARNPQTRHQITASEDLSGIKVRSRYMDVYLVMADDALEQLILPVSGKGLWSTMYGFVSLAADLNTIKGFAFYEHGETPGLGGEIDNPTWKKQWIGKRVYGQSGGVRIEVIKGKVDKHSSEALYQSDGLAGATLTARGVHNLLHYWFGQDGYKRLLDRIKHNEVTL